MSSFYVPMAGHPDHEPMLLELRRLFDELQTDGTVRIAYATEVYSGRV